MTLERITSPLLQPFKHGFYTRLGGASSGIFAGLNCGLSSSDQAEIVSINRARVAQDLGVKPQSLVTVHQTHSADVLIIDAAIRPATSADALVTATPQLALGVLSADCQPVLFADPKAGVIGAAHAGWRGALDGILEATLEAMENLGAQRENISAVIGPCISQAAYEVGQEFFERFADHDPTALQYFINSQTVGKYLFDLPGYGLSRLRAANVKTAAWTRDCSYADARRFYSYRRTTHQGQADYGRMIATIKLGA
ncbi:MAG: peptidoglycan editing factor PgeF [Paracoccaceae bacterium]